MAKTLIGLMLGVAIPGMAHGQPANDLCSQPIVISALPFSQFMDLQLATNDGIPGCPVAQDCWYYFAPNADGEVIAEASLSTSLVSIYAVPGGVPSVCPTSADRIACGDGEGLLPVSAGTAYWFQVGTTGNFQLRAFNDHCQLAAVVPSLPFSGTAEHEFATQDGIPGCTLYADLWFDFVAPQDGELSVQSYLVGDVSIYAIPGGVPGTCPVSSQRIVCSEDSIELPVAAGTMYVFQVGKDFNAGSSLASTLVLDWLTPPANDSCLAPTTLAIPADIDVDFLGAEDSDPGVPCSMPNDLWYRITATQDGSIEVSLDADDESLALYFSSGSCPTPTDLLACGDSPFIFSATAGQEFLIQAGSSSPSNLDDLTVEYVSTPGVPDDRYILEIEPRSVSPGPEFQLPVLLSCVAGTLGPAEPLQGWSYGVCVDPLELLMIDVAIGSTTATVNGGSIASLYNHAINPGQGFLSAAVIDLLGVNVLPAGSDYELNVVTFEPLVPAPYLALLPFCDTVGNPPVPVVVVSEGAPIIPVTIAGEVLISDQPGFRRADANLDGTVNIADAVAILGYAFPSGTSAPLGCLDAADANDDEAINIADPILVLAVLFGSPPTTLPPPSCGFDPTPGPLGCDLPGACP